jgi:cell division protein FtsN
MQDQNFHEIQLSGKQLLFGFISAVVLLVVIFLLGVSVGRGVRTEPAPGDSGATAAGSAPGDTVVPAPPPPATPQPGDLTYQPVLKGQPQAGTPSDNPPPPAEPPKTGSAPPQTSGAPPATTGASRSAPPPSAPQDKPQSTATPAAAPAKPAPDAGEKTAPPASGGWFAQIGAYGTRQAAQARQKELTAKGFAATVTPFGTLFRVRVGPFTTQAEAEREKARLATAGFPSSVIR